MCQIECVTFITCCFKSKAFRMSAVECSIVHCEKTVSHFQGNRFYFLSEYKRGVQF